MGESVSLIDQIEKFRQKYGMSFEEFFDCVESFSCLQELMEKFDIEEILRDSLEWEELEEKLERLLKVL